MKDFDSDSIQIELKTLSVKLADFIDGAKEHRKTLCEMLNEMKENIKDTNKSLSETNESLLKLPCPKQMIKMEHVEKQLIGMWGLFTSIGLYIIYQWIQHK